MVRRKASGGALSYLVACMGYLMSVGSVCVCVCPISTLRKIVIGAKIFLLIAPSSFSFVLTASLHWPDTLFLSPSLL